MHTRTRRREAAKALIDRAIRETYLIAGEHNGPGFAYLLNEVQKRSDLLPPSRYIGRADANSLVEIVGGLLALSVHVDDWRRPIEDWEPRESNPLPLFDELAHYLLADYPVPPVMRSVWFLGISYQARHRQGWYKHVGGGGSLRTARFPLDLTRRMAHEFAQAPRTFAVEYALRWAQVIALGGSDELARAIASTRLGLEFNEDEFWTQVVHFFINHPELDHDHIGPIVEYIEHQKFQPVKVLIGESTEIELDPPQPNFTIKGRTAASILRLVADWRQKGPAVLTRRVFCWQPSATGGYREEAEDGRVWTIRELLDSDELAAEGTAMHHCVATYTPACIAGTSTIWSLGVETPEGRERLLTIEVDPKSREVVEARMNLNEFPDEQARGLLVRWAEAEGLTAGCWGVAVDEVVAV